MDYKQMNRLLFIGLLLMIFAPLTHAQIKIGAKVGYSVGRIADTSDNIYTEEYDSTDGIDFGVTAEFPISELISIQTELLYTQRGGIREGVQPIPADQLKDALAENGISEQALTLIMALNGRGPVTDENPLYADFKNVSELEYIEIPVLLKLGWGTDWRFYVEGGGYVGFLIGATQVTSGESQFFTDGTGNQPIQVPNPFYNPEDPSFGPPLVPLPPQDFDASTDVKDDLNTTNYVLAAGAGLIRKINDKNQVYLGFRGTYGFATLQKDSTFGESVIGGLVFSVGYAYTL